MGAAKSQKNKAHKTKFATKSSRNAHKMGGGTGSKVAGKSAARAIPTGQRARDLRLQRSKNIRGHKRATVLAEKRASSGASSSPRILAIVALSSTIDVPQLKKQIISHLSSKELSGANAQHDDVMETEELLTQKLGLETFAVPRFKLRLSVLEAPREDLQACLEVAKMADIIAFAVPASEDGEYVDKAGKTVLSMMRAIGFPTTIGLFLGLTGVAPKKRSDAKKAALAALQAELPEDSKCFPADNADDFQQVMRHLADQRLSGPQWRSERPYVVSEKLQFSALTADTGTLLLSGYIRGRGLSVNQLVHVAGAGDFQFNQIDILDDPCLLLPRRSDATGESMTVEENVNQVILPDAGLQEPLIVENTPDSLAGEQTWPTEDELAKAGEENRKRLKKRLLPKGTSDYQASWIVEDSDEENDQEGDDLEGRCWRGADMVDDNDEEVSRGRQSK